MSKISSINDSLDNSDEILQKLLYCSDEKINSTKIKDKVEFVPNVIIKSGYNSCSILGNNKLFKSFINSKNNKEKELSLLCLINTFNKSYSNESTDKNNIIIDLPKISKKLFSNSHIRHKSSNNLDINTFQKNLHLAKCGGEIVNNFFSNIYSGEISNYTISPKKNKKGKQFFNSGNKENNCPISPFSNGNNKFERLFSNKLSCTNLNTGFNFEIKEQNEINHPEKENNICTSSLLSKVTKIDRNNEKEEEKKYL